MKSPRFLSRRILFLRYCILIGVMLSGLLSGCQCGGDVVHKTFECESHENCSKSELCEKGKCVFRDEDKDGYAPKRGPVSDCDDKDPKVNPGYPEICDNQKDDNCDGKTDETPCRCEDGQTRECGADKGSCQKGTQTCNSAGKWEECKGGIKPERETCNSIDDDCDGLVDEDFTLLGKKCEVGQGECKAQGKYVCSKDRKAAECDATPGQPEKEECDKKDNDCDGLVDELQKCQKFQMRKSSLSTATVVGKNTKYRLFGVVGSVNPPMPTTGAKAGGYKMYSGFLPWSHASVKSP